MWLILGFNSDNADFYGYKYYYDQRIVDSIGSGLNTGYILTEQLAWALGFDFYQYRMLFGGIALALIYRFIVKYSNMPCAVLSLYLVLPFLYDVTQFKFFLAASIAITGISFLIDKNRHFILYYILLTIISILIHPASAIFLFFFMGLFDKKKAILVSLMITVISIFCIYSGIAQIFLGYFMDSVKAEVYLSNISRFGWIPYGVSTLFIMILVISIQNEFTKNELFLLDKDKSPSNKFLIFFNSGVFAFLPLTVFCIISLQNFYRPIRSALIMIYIFYFIAVKSSYISKKSKSIFTLGFMLWYLYTVYIIMAGVFKVVVDIVLTHNLLW